MFINDQISNNLQDIAQQFIKHFAAISNSCNSPSDWNEIPLKQNFNLEYNKPISLHELKKAISCTKLTTPGPDCFHINMLKFADLSI
ncbi:hypothetical protein PGB90_001307 [Kerria lacca]